jgi:hypothetical protein
MKTPALPPTPSGFTRTVAERHFVCRDAEGEHPLRVEFGEPKQDVEVVNGTDWRCSMRITLGTQSTVRSIVGIDSLQSLQLAINLARAELEAIATRPGTALLYLDEPVDTSQPDWQCTLL